MFNKQKMLQVSLRNQAEDALTSAFICSSFQWTAFLLNSLFAKCVLLVFSLVLSTRVLSNSQHGCGMKTALVISLHTCACTRTIFWQHLTVFCVMRAIWFDHNSETHDGCHLLLEVAVITLFSTERRREDSPGILHFHLKSPFGCEVADFCALASCWHHKSEPVAPSGASTAATPGTGCAEFVICSAVSASAVLCLSTEDVCSPSLLLVYWENSNQLQRSNTRCASRDVGSVLCQSVFCIPIFSSNLPSTGFFKDSSNILCCNAM